MACVSQEQSITVLFFLEMEVVFQEFLQNKSGSLESEFLKHFHPLSTISRVVSFNLKLGSLNCNTISSYVSGQNDLLLTIH